MAFKKTLVQRLFNLSRFSTPNLSRTTTIKPDPKPNRTNQIPRRPIHQSTAALPPSTAAMRLFPVTGSALSETLKGMDVTKGRLHFDELVAENAAGLTVGEVRKVLMATQSEVIRDQLRCYGKDWVSYDEYLELIGDFCGGNKEFVLLFAKNLDDCGSVIVLGNSVCLRPLQVAKAIHGLVTPPLSTDPNDPRRKELELMEEQKAEIDQKADALVRRELWAGLGYMVVQTAAFMRLTFWELSWDVMEPICFYVTSAYFMLGYTFFLRTSKEPSFEGFFKSRFNAKQKRLMKAQEFNLERYNELRKVFHSHSSSSSSSLDDTRLTSFDCYKAN
ncbi:hypothetical protein KSS87_010804 [Heliosperma pusillum]|nr:hypothetical protein KSS87_006973 [Heliosperma pusillum]KAH9621128.1 hypothetical protein KSS87_010804 [Heliosperma pusillum]